MKRDKEKEYKIAIDKEWQAVLKQEGKLKKSALKQEAFEWKQVLEDKVPEKVYDSLQKAFRIAFQTVFEKGVVLIEKTYNRQAIEEDLDVREYEFQVKSDRKSLRKIRKNAASSSLKNMAITTVEGVGLGALGIGLPDIVVFVGVLLKGIYEVALRYGFEYDSPKEQYFILKLMEASMQRGIQWEDCNSEIDQFIQEKGAVEKTQEEVRNQITLTSQVFAADMILLKFVQGLPVVGVLGGLGNPVYYNRVLTYAQLKYRKRYLNGLR